MYSTHLFRKEFNLTQKQFAEKFNVSIGTVKNWDSRCNMPVYIHNMLMEIWKIEEEYRAYQRRTEDYLKNRI